MDGRNWSLQGLCEPHRGITLLSEKLLIWGLAQQVLTTCKFEQQVTEPPGQSCELRFLRS